MNTLSLTKIRYGQCKKFFCGQKKKKKKNGQIDRQTYGQAKSYIPRSIDAGA